MTFGNAALFDPAAANIFASVVRITADFCLTNAEDGLCASCVGLGTSTTAHVVADREVEMLMWKSPSPSQPIERTNPVTPTKSPSLAEVEPRVSGLGYRFAWKAGPI